MLRLTALALLAMAFLAQNAAAQNHVDVVVDAGTSTLTAASDGTHTAQVTLSNLLGRQLPLQAVVPGQPGCTVDANPSSLPGGTRTPVTLTLHANCDVGSGVRINFGFGARPTAASPGLVAEPATAGPRWDIVGWSFVLSLAVAVGVVAELGFFIRGYNHLGVPSVARTRIGHPRGRPAGPGPVPKGHYVYAITAVSGTRWWSRIEGGLGHESSPIHLASPSTVKLTIPFVDNARKRCIYRRLRCEPLSAFRRVGEIRDSDQSLFLDGWKPLGISSELRGLGTDWSLKDNWIGNVTVGATVLVALLASSSTFGDVVGPSAKPALTAMAVAAAVASVFVGLGPLIVKSVGSDLSYTTVGGMLGAALFTLFGTLGQIAATTWEVEASTADARLAIGVAVIGVVVGFVVIWYALWTLWYYLKTGALIVQTAPKHAGLAGQAHHTALL